MKELAPGPTVYSTVVLLVFSLTIIVANDYIE